MKVIIFAREPEGIYRKEREFIVENFPVSVIISIGAERVELSLNNLRELKQILQPYFEED